MPKGVLDRARLSQFIRDPQTIRAIELLAREVEVAGTVRTFIARKQAENAQTTQFTAPSIRARIEQFTVTNTSASSVTFSVNLVASGDTPGDDNLIIDAYSIGAGASYTCPEAIAQVLEEGDYISTLASASGALTMSASGRIYAS